MGKKSKNRVKETPFEREAARIAAEEWNRYQQVFVPLENEFIQQIQIGPQDYQFAQGLAAGENRQQFSQAQRGLETQLAAGGVNPNSGRFQGAISDLNTAQGQSAAAGVTQANVDTRRRQIRGLNAAIGMGRGQAVQADLGFRRQAAAESQRAISDAQLAFQKNAATQGAVGTAAGLGLGAYQNRETFRKPLPDYQR